MLECVPQSPESTLTSPTAHCQPAEPTGSSVSPTPFLLHFPRGPHTPSALPYPPACTSTQSSHSCTHIPLACPQAPAHSFTGSRPLLPPPSSHEVTHAWLPYPPHTPLISPPQDPALYTLPHRVSCPHALGPLTLTPAHSSCIDWKCRSLRDYMSSLLPGPRLFLHLESHPTNIFPAC